MTNKSGKNGRKELTHRQRAMIKALVKGKSQAQAYREAGYSPKNADQGAYQVLQSIKKKIPEIMDENRLTDEALIGKHLASLLNATEVKAFNHKGKVIYSEPLEALDIRLRALEQAFKLKGSYAPVQDQQSYTGIQVILMDKIPRPNQEKFLEAERALAAGNGHRKNGDEPDGLSGVGLCAERSHVLSCDRRQ